jgi:hypothetical protein
MRAFICVTILLLILLPSLTIAAEEMTKMEIGARGGVSDNRNEENHKGAEIYFLKQLPWGSSFGENSTISTRFDMGATYLEADSDSSGMVAIGADLVLGLWDNQMEFEVGFRPTWMFDYEYGGEDFGGGMQFTSHAGLAINWQPMTLSYRFQHISNAGIYNKNPGLNLHMVGLGYRF